jgi:hypothetical protein
VFGIFVLICVPALTRMGQRLETASHTPSFSKNIDCPPKKITVASSFAVVLSFTFKPTTLSSVFQYPTPEGVLLSSTFVSIPPPFRAPPPALLA